MSFLSDSKCRVKSQEVFGNMAVIGTTGCKMWLEATSGKLKSNRKKGRYMDAWFAVTIGL